MVGDPFRFRVSLAALAVMLGLALGPAVSSTPQGAARTDGKNFAGTLVPRARTEATTQPDANRIPQFTTNPQPQIYYSSPAALEAAAMSQAPGHPGYQSVQQSIGSRAHFDPQEIRDTTQLGRAVSADPQQYVSGFSADGQTGVCRPLPAGNVSPGRYEQSCNSGYTRNPSTQTCNIALQVQTSTQYRYDCSHIDWQGNQVDNCAIFAGCQVIHQRPGRCLQWGGPGWCAEPGEPIEELACPAPVPGGTLVGTQTVVTGTTRDESQCASWATDPQCAPDPDVCTDSDPVTRVVNGVAVTQPCWAWSRTYQCAGMQQMSDCGELEGMGCTFLREACLTGETPCLTVDRVYSCPIPPAPGETGQICDGDIYCINGECETIDRQPNTEFRDAVVALNAIAQAGKEFDPDNLTLFKGEAMACTKAVFGVVNCCRPRGLPLIGGCGAGDQALKARRDKGECTYVGTWCSSKVLGICLAKKERHCCYLSKISRILQEQGRPQIGKVWDDPEDEQCLGFTIDEFAQLDLSRMDFSEVYAEFTEAAKLPDELATLSDMQAKIQAFYQQGNP